MGLGLHIIKYPSGAFGFAGSVPANYAYRYANSDELLSDADIHELLGSSNPAMSGKVMGIVRRTFPTKAAAEEFARIMS